MEYSSLGPFQIISGKECIGDSLVKINANTLSTSAACVQIVTNVNSLSSTIKMYETDLYTNMSSFVNISNQIYTSLWTLEDAFYNLGPLSSAAFSVYSTVTAVSANWDRTYTTLREVSAKWNNTFTNLTANSGSWEHVYNFVVNNSAFNNSLLSSVYLNVRDLSSFNNNLLSSVYTNVRENSALISQKADSAHTAVWMNSSNWDYGVTLWQTASANYLMLNNYVSSLSTLEQEVWQYQDFLWPYITNVTLLSGRTMSVFSTVSAASGSWNNTYTTVRSSSASWNNAYTVVAPSSASWDNTYLAVRPLSAQLPNIISLSSTSTQMQQGTGYCVLPNKLILQWGRTLGLKTSDGVSSKILFPYPFPNRVLNISTTRIATDFTAATIVGACSIKSNFDVYGFFLIQDTSASANSSEEMWTAIGY